MQTQNYDRYVTSHLGFVQKENHETMSRYFAKNYLRHLGKKTSQVLEIGCGLGSFLYFLQQYGFVNYSAIDLSEECVSSCIDMGLGSQANLERADAFDFLKNSPKKFDVIVMNDVIEHIEKEKIVEMLKLIYVSLADGGRLIIKVVNSSNVGSSSRSSSTSRALSSVGLEPSSGPRSSRCSSSSTRSSTSQPGTRGS